MEGNSAESIAFVETLLGRLSSTDPGIAVLHPLGFVQFKLKHTTVESQKLHVWPSFPIDCGARPGPIIHSHRWHLESRIVCGELGNTIYSVIPSAEPDHQVFQVHHQGDHDLLEATGQLVKCDPIQCQRWRTEDQYTLPSGIYHETSRLSSRAVATILIARESAAGIRSSILAPLNAKSFVHVRRPCPLKLAIRVVSDLRDELRRQRS